METPANSSGSEPKIAPVVSIRLIRSFYHRNIRNLVLKDVDLGLKTSEFKDFVTQKAKTASNLPPPFKTFAYDCFKVRDELRNQNRAPFPGLIVDFFSQENKTQRRQMNVA